MADKKAYETKVQVKAYVDKDFYRRVKVFAAVHGLTFSGMVEGQLTKYMDKVEGSSK
jgi:hypothetical protein